MRFLSGFMSGVSVSAAAVQAAVAKLWLPSLRGMYRDLDARLFPAETRLVLAPGWAPCVVLALLALVVALNAPLARWPRARAAALTALAVTVPVGT